VCFLCATTFFRALSICKVKKKGKLDPVYTMKPCMGNIGKLYSFLCLAYDRSQPKVKNPWYLLSRRLGGLQS